MWCTELLRSKVDQDQTHVTEGPVFTGENVCDEECQKALAAVDNAHKQGAISARVPVSEILISFFNSLTTRYRRWY